MTSVSQQQHPPQNAQQSQPQPQPPTQQTTYSRVARVSENAMFHEHQGQCVFDLRDHSEASEGSVCVMQFFIGDLSAKLKFATFVQSQKRCWKVMRCVQFFWIQVLTVLFS